MAGEIQVSYVTTKTLYCLIRNRTGQIWNGTTFETYATANYATYVVSLVEQGTASAFYVGTFPASIAGGVYSLIACVQAAGSPVETDRCVGNETFQWNGSAAMPLYDVASSGQIGQFLPGRIARGTMLQNFLFDLVSDVDNKTPFTSGVVSGTISRDGGVFGPLQSGAVTEVGQGVYKVNLTSGDLLANTAFLAFTAVGVSGGQAARRKFSFVLERTSGQG